MAVHLPLIDTADEGGARLSLDNATRLARAEWPLQEKMRFLEDYLASLGELVVGFSGGVDSAFLAGMAHKALGNHAVALTAVSPSLPKRERDHATEIAAEIGIRHVLRESDEIHNPKYRENPNDRCYYCKSALFDLADLLQHETGIQHVAIGTNLDDLGGHRPGMKAAHERGALHPLVEAGFRKKDVRDGCKELGLSVWNKPEFACLSSRFPYGTAITSERLNKVETCEDVLRDLDFRVFRVRYHDEVVRIELGQDEIGRLFDTSLREEVVRRCKAAGFKYISLDLQGYRRGSMNE